MKKSLLFRILLGFSQPAPATAPATTQAVDHTWLGAFDRRHDGGLLDD